MAIRFDFVVGSATVAQSFLVDRTASATEQRRIFLDEAQWRDQNLFSSVVTRALLEKLRGRQEIRDPLGSLVQEVIQKCLSVCFTYV